MQHLDEESLSLLALGEDLGDDAADHLRSCADCAAELEGLRRVVVAARPGPEGAALAQPGPHVWVGIHSALGLGSAVAADPLGPLPESPLRPAAPSPSGVPAELPAELPPPEAGTRWKQGRKKQDRTGGAGWIRRPGVWLAAAAATVLLAAGVVWSVQRNQPTVTPLAQAALAPVDQHSATGSARVVEAADGQRTLEVQVDKNEARGYQEVWLIAPDLSRLVSLGVMTSESGTFALPAGLDLSEYPIVDVSDEPVDGNPAHSSVSIVRGTLAT